MKLGNRFWSKVNKDAPNGCWEWTGTGGRKGYGHYRIDGAMRRAHRLSFQEAYGEIGEGLYIDHLCFNPKCVNPSHLRAVDAYWNAQHRDKGGVLSSTGVRGISQRKPGAPYYARGYVAGKLKVLGRFADLKDAEAFMTLWRSVHYPGSLEARTKETTV